MNSDQRFPTLETERLILRELVESDIPAYEKHFINYSVIMTEAANAVNDYAFTQLNFEKLIFENAVGNHKSRRVKEKTGARFIRNAEAKYVDPDLTGGEIFELTKEDWTKFKNSEMKKYLA